MLSGLARSGVTGVGDRILSADGVAAATREIGLAGAALADGRRASAVAAVFAAGVGAGELGGGASLAPALAGNWLTGFDRAAIGREISGSAASA
jgi:hypothetical protein